MKKKINLKLLFIISVICIIIFSNVLPIYASSKKLIPIGIITLSNPILVLNILFIFVIKKSVYLKYPNRPKLTNIPKNKIIFLYRMRSADTPVKYVPAQ